MVQNFFAEQEAKAQAAAAEKGKVAKEAGEQFLAENAKKDGIITTKSGLQYQILREGNGKAPKATDQVECHYVETLIGAPMTSIIGDKIKGTGHVRIIGDTRLARALLGRRLGGMARAARDVRRGRRAGGREDGRRLSRRAVRRDAGRNPPPPSFTATIISRAILVKACARLASAAPLVFCMLCHLECPDIVTAPLI